MIERFLMVSISLFECTFAGSVVYFSMMFRKFDVIFALYIMFVIWHWLERGQSGLFIQLQFTACVFFSVITSLLCILITDSIFAM